VEKSAVSFDPTLSPAPAVGFHKAQDFSLSQQPARYRLIKRMAAGGRTGQANARQTKAI